MADATPEATQMGMTTQFFDDISSHAAALDNWSQHYDQLTPGCFQGALEDLQVPGMRLFRERLNSRVAQHTRAPRGTANILVPVQVAEASRGILSDGLTLLPHDGDFYFCTPPGTDYVVVSLELAWLQRLLVPEDLSCFMERPRGYGLRCNASALHALQLRLLQVLACASVVGAEPSLDAARAHPLRDEVLCLLLAQIDPRGTAARLRDLSSSHQYIVRHCHARVLASEAPLGVLDLCRELRIPHRTLHHAFERTTGLSPNRYLRAVRLNAADRSLRGSPRASVTDTAYRWGFAHASHFGKEYKKLFGRTPSGSSTAPR